MTLESSFLENFRLFSEIKVLSYNTKTRPTHTSIAPSLVPNELYRIGPAWLVLLTGTHISICSTWASRGDRLGGSAVFSVTSESFTATASSNSKSSQLCLRSACGRQLTRERLTVYVYFSYVQWIRRIRWEFNVWKTLPRLAVWEYKKIKQPEITPQKVPRNFVSSKSFGIDCRNVRDEDVK